jgi:hypothetical protein
MIVLSAFSHETVAERGETYTGAQRRQMSGRVLLAKYINMPTAAYLQGSSASTHRAPSLSDPKVVVDGRWYLVSYNRLDRSR